MSADEQIQQLINDFSHYTHRELLRLFGNEKANGLHKLYDRQFRIHYNNYKHMMTTAITQRHGMYALFLMALDDVLMEIKASYSQLRKSALNVFKDMLFEFLESEVQQFLQEPAPWTAFITWLKASNKANYDNDYFRLEEVQNDEKYYGFDIHRCFYFEILKESGRPELGPILCDYDSLIAEVVENWITFTRHKTIASGDSKCTFRYEKK